LIVLEVDGGAGICGWLNSVERSSSLDSCFNWTDEPDDAAMD
jgi:hypothetical protein